MKLNIAWPKPGRYILAVSGGADSTVLMNVLALEATARGYELVVTHFDHGMRPESAADAEFVQSAAQVLGLRVVTKHAKLGPASEAKAREARHSWLEQVRQDNQAGAIITAHHQDDLIETSLLNLARGTGRRGLAPMDGPILRPLIGATRADLRAYAKAHNITWREDPTNADTSNPRNLLRHELLAHASPKWLAKYLSLISKMALLNKKIDHRLSDLLEPAHTGADTYSFPRQTIRDLSLREVSELISAAARSLDPAIEFDRRALAEIALFAKTARPHRRRPLRGNLQVVVEPGTVSVYYMGTSVIRRR